MSSGTTKRIALGALSIVGGIGVAVGLLALTMQPPVSDLVSLTLFLSISGGLTITLSLAIAYFGLPSGLSTIRARIIAIAGFMAVMALANVAITSYLMFLSSHDLALLSGLILFSLITSVFIAYVVTGPTLRSISDVMRTVTRISAGDLEARVEVRTDDEIGQLAAAINEMSAKLDASLKSEREVEEARKELFRAVSHDLRTPLASMRAMVEGINDGVVNDPETISRYMHTIQREIGHLSQLIGDLFELTQIESGVLSLHLEPASVGDLVSDTLEGMAAQAAEGNVRLAGDVDQAVPPVVLDASRIQRVLYNLVQNSIRHTPPDGSVMVHAHETSKGVEIEVRDDGEGVRNEDLPHIFDRFWRAESSRSRDFGGTGMGLAIARTIVEAHGGQIWATSDEGEGCAIAFRLPKADEAHEPEPVA